MSLNVWSFFRIAALLLVATGCAWVAGEHLDKRSFQNRNSAAIAACEALTPGMPVGEAESRARAFHGAVVVPGEGKLLVRVPGQSLCFVEIVGGKVRSATVARNG
jgi:hypothetical protein